MISSRTIPSGFTITIAAIWRAILLGDVSMKHAITLFLVVAVNAVAVLAAK
jgi:hypothetical protein